MEVVKTICSVLQQEVPSDLDYEGLISYVKDRPGHDRRYAIDTRKIEGELGWAPKENFESGIRKTIRWYLENMAWVGNVTSGAYQQWIATNYAARG